MRDDKSMISSGFSKAYPNSLWNSRAWMFWCTLMVPTSTAGESVCPPTQTSHFLMFSHLGLPTDILLSLCIFYFSLKSLLLSRTVTFLQEQVRKMYTLWFLYVTLFDVNKAINFIQGTSTWTVSLSCVNSVTSNTHLLSALLN